MTTTSTSQTFGQWLIATLEQDVAQTGGSPLVTLLTNWQTHAGNNLQQGADLIAFTAQAPAAGIALEIELEQQLLQLALSKVQSFIASKAAGVSQTAAAPVVG